MIAGIGIDMIEVERVQEKIARNASFKSTVFSPAEIAYCDRQTNSAESYAARFAAKEAFLKALGKGMTLGYELTGIEVVTDADSRPHMRLAGVFAEEMAKLMGTRIHVSLCHLKSVACAVVIIER